MAVESGWKWAARRLARLEFTGRCRVLAVATIAAAILLGADPLRAQQPILTPGTPRQITPAAPSDRQGRQVKLRDQLRVGLKAKTKADLAFIDLVVLRVNQGVLPRKLVDATFLWARNRHRSHNNIRRLRPMVYFQPALVRQARKLGVTL